MILKDFSRVAEKVMQRGCSMGSGLSAEAIQSIELIRGITLPEEYRLFINKFGNGGVGLLGIRKAIAEYNPKVDFVYDESVICSDEEYNALRKNSIILCKDDEGTYVLLAKGEDKGYVWHITKGVDFVCGGMLYSPDTNEPMGFLEWYEMYLEEAFYYVKAASF